MKEAQRRQLKRIAEKHLGISPFDRAGHVEVEVTAVREALKEAFFAGVTEHFLQVRLDEMSSNCPNSVCASH